VESDRFDALTVQLVTPVSRRRSMGVLGFLVGGSLAFAGGIEARKKKKKKVTLCLNGQTVKVPKKRKRSYLDQGATSGACSGACVRQCGGKTCGDDGCGGSCGSCQGQLTCQGGTCACPPGDEECAPGVCVPTSSTACCTDPDCQGDERCIRGTCVMWQGTCPAGADSCDFEVENCGAGCTCRQSVEGDTRCSDTDATFSACDECITSADCEAMYPMIPGVFCMTSGPGCCPGRCRKPCI
jgi:hypothetical protein